MCVFLQGQQLMDLEHKLAVAKEELEKTALDKVNENSLLVWSLCSQARALQLCHRPSDDKGSKQVSGVPIGEYTLTDLEYTDETLNQLQDALTIFEEEAKKTWPEDQLVQDRAHACGRRS